MLPQTNENVFSRDNLKEVAEISEHIVFSEQMLEKYDWSDETEENFKRLIDNIKRKNADDKFNLSIVGEFSTGKSSFINALLKTPLMAAQMLQGTTVAATSIEYSDEYKVKTILNSGEERTVVASDLSQLKNVIDTYTTETDTAKDLHSVYVYLPAGDFSKKIRIIDTPGTNVEKMWHESVTVRAIEEISDASVVLIDATKVLPQSLTRFVNANLSNVISRCIFVVTKIDLIPPNERKRVLDYVKVKVKQEFEIEKPIVVGYSSVAALDEQNELYPMCMESEKVIFETIRLKSVLIQVEKLLSLTDKMYSEMDEEINLVKTVYEQELTLIERSKNVDLNDFIRSEKEDRKKQFRRSMNMLALELETVLNYMEYDERECIKAELDDIANLDTLKNYVDVVLVDRVKKTAEKLCSFTQGCFSGINGGFGEEINVFQEHLKKNLKNLMYYRLTIT